MVRHREYALTVQDDEDFSLTGLFSILYSYSFFKKHFTGCFELLGNLDLRFFILGLLVADLSVIFFLYFLYFSGVVIYLNGSSKQFKVFRYKKIKKKGKINHFKLIEKEIF